MKRLYRAHAKALTLMELLVVLAIIGIIMMMAMPKFDALFGSVRSEEAKQQLAHLFTLQKTHFFRTAEYTTEFQKISFQQEKLSTEGGAANYLIEIVDASTTTYLAQATAVKDFNGNGVMNVWTIDHERNLVEVAPD
jgi:type IV pilus assembly protein PilE